MNPRYSMLIRWSDDDEAYLVSFPELIGPDRPQTHGRTYQEAASRGEEALAALLDAFAASGRPLPEPDVLRGESIGAD